ncbi:MAG: AmmeMemoRadiSam system radical SAM enzyme [Gammaproteobacteria bacterium]|nr:AmmeMemoRadiSam system radical SAM enzyme [Gammaproteobacteria bacterium]
MVEREKFEAEFCHPTQYWHVLDDARVQCDVCPRFCKLHEGQRGLCFVRACQEQKIILTTYGRSSGFCVDPIEKKPLNHFLPGTPVLSFGTAGCNLACKYCQNWDISKSRETHRLTDQATPEAIVQAAIDSGSRSVAYTYNDPIIFLEYAIDVAKLCRQHKINNVAVTAGYVEPKPAAEFFSYMDAANIDLKSFSEDFYWKITGGHLQPVLDTLEYVKHETQCWLEITTLLIPGKNDSDQELNLLTQWINEKLGAEVPLHFSAFHPDWKMQDIPSTPQSTLDKARQIAKANGLHHVYTGNVHDKAGQSTYCHHCGELLIGRDWYELSDWNLDQGGHCQQCHTPLAGVFEAQAGHWGSKRRPIVISR